MKKTVSFVLIVSLLLSVCLLSGCGDDKPQKVKKEEEKGAKHVIELNTDYNSGLEWQFKVSKKGIVKISKSFIPEADEGLKGKTVYTVTALKPGTVKVDFRLEGDFENKEHLEANYSFTVTKDLTFVDVILGGSYYDSLKEN